MSGALVLLSGGLDSAAALAWAHQNFSTLYAITFQYHLRPARERLAVLRLIQRFPAKLREIPVPYLMEAGDFRSELSIDVPEGYISNRNMIFYSIAIHFAELQGCTTIIGGHTKEDVQAFPDAGTEFFRELQELSNQALQINKIQIELPLSQLSKLQVLEKALQWNVPLEYTWSCYGDYRSPCGVCVSCIERAEAFTVLGIKDPLCTT